VNTLRTKERRKWARRERRSFTIGNRIFGTKERPRLSVYRSGRHFHCQLIDDSEGRTLASASTLQKDIRAQVKHGGDRKAAELVGKKVAEAAKAAGITKVIFDRNFYRFHGRVRSFAEAAAAGGLQFLVNPEKGPKAPKAPKADKPAAKPEKEKKAKPAGEGKPAGKPEGKGPEGKAPEGKKGPEGKK